jgi:cytochrome o ubiquinol oxidase subunit 2
MNKKVKTILLALIFFGIMLAGLLFLFYGNIVMFDPKGIIALKQRNLMITSTLLMLIVVIPVFILTAWIAWRYRAKNKKAKYTPEWDFNLLAESIWWGLPLIIIIILSVMTFKSSHDLDPFKPIQSNVKPMTIQVVSLQWKWLFIYPEQNIATVNFVQFPDKTPIVFEITSDAPMNSFWIPQLGGQIYAMSGMKSKLHLIADEPGVFRGSSANISGEGFAGMTFTAKATSQEDFDQWVQSVKESPNGLSRGEYEKLVKPSQNNPAAVYSLQDEGLFDWIIMKYMMPMPQTHN